MKIEKLNDNQIRCILNKSDLEERKLELSELAYGSSKAKELFRDMMEQAAMEYGFEVDNIPLMIEAIPVSSECLILVVTKVEDPEELDTRFSRFSSLLEDDEMLDSYEEEDFEALDTGINDDMFESLQEEEDLSFGSMIEQPQSKERASSEEENSDEEEHSDEEAFDIMAPFNKAIAKAKQELRKKKNAKDMPRTMEDQIYAFDSLDQVITLCTHLEPFYQGDSVLYKDTQQGAYYLVLLRQDTDQNLYKRACTICADHGECIMTSYASLAYFKEHFQLICETDAIGQLNHLT